MVRVAELPALARFAGGIYAQRALLLWHARVRGDLLSRLNDRPSRTDPYPIYEEMRAQGPLLRTRLGNCSTTSHALCNEVLRSREFGVVSEESPGQSPRRFLDLSILNLNPPEHTRIRRLAGPAFSPRRMAGYAELVDQAVHSVLDQMERTALHSGSFDLMPAVASPLPIAVITRVLGLPDEPVRFRRLGSTIATALDGIWSLRQARELAAAERELRRDFDALVRQKAADPGPDLTSALLGELGSSITAEELAPLVRLLLIAGFETTVNAIGTGIRWLLADRSQWDVLVAEPDRAGAVAEEVLRFDPPVQQTGRVARADVELAGQPVRRGQWVITLLAAANRDPEVFTAPNRFDVTRSDAGEHLAFSGGVHYCLGAPLARLELSRALRALAERYPTLHPAGPVRMRRAATLRGPLSVPLQI